MAVAITVADNSTNIGVAWITWIWGDGRRVGVMNVRVGVISAALQLTLIKAKTPVRAINQESFFREIAPRISLNDPSVMVICRL